MLPLAWSTEFKRRTHGAIAARMRRRIWQRAGRSTASERLSADIEEFLPPLLADGVSVHLFELTERLGDGLARVGDHGGGVAMRAPDRLLEDLIDHAESQHVLGGDLHVVGGLLRLGAVAPQDRGGGLRRDHAIDRV